jgi:hypothetical protein
MTVHRGGCHCGALRFEAEGELEGLEVCNCSICLKKGTVHWYVPRERFHLLCEDPPLSTYRFGTGRARHHFCAECGVSPYYVPRSDPDKIDVNVRCLDGMTLERLGALETTLFDGEHWEDSHRRLRGDG